jgi:Ca-activated chloride channel family protein
MDRKLLPLAVLAALFGLPGLAQADGMMIPVRPDVPSFSVVYHRVKVSIDRQVATTEIDQAFRSGARVPVEATYVFPLADGLSLSKFSMYAGGEELTHRVLDKDEARRIYNGIVQQRRDPALLEWVGTRAVQARVYPVQPNEDKQIRLSYQEVLKAQDGIIKYVYPLKTEKLSAKPLEDCSVEIALRSPQPIRSVYSPTHNVTIQRDGEKAARVTYQAKNVLPDQDLVLYYTVSEADLGLDVLTYRDPAKGDGYFLLLAAPKTELRENEVQPKDVVFVLDTSGSMAGDKIRQAKGALKFCVNSLDPRDRFNLIAFSNDVRPWRDGLQQATPENVKDAEAFVDKFTATGGTNINGALDSALATLTATDAASASRPPVVIFLTDGLPTVGTTDVNQILANAKKANTRQARVFDFGVGNDYNAHFLDKLANEHNGYAENVLPTEDIEVKVSSFYGKISAPLLMNLKVDWGGVTVYDVYPPKLPDLFKGSQLLVAGRYEPKGETKSATIELSGDVTGRRQAFRREVVFPGSALADDFLPRLWATRKIGFLEDQIQLNGASKELLEEVIRLSKEHGILSQYTSFLVDLDVNAPGGPRTNLIGKGDSGLAADGLGRVNVLREPQAGAAAVSQSVSKKDLMYAQQPASASGNVILTADGRRVRMSQVRNVSQRSFVQSGTRWYDVNFDDKQKLVKVKAFSPAYLQLADLHPRMAHYLSVGSEVIVALKDTAIQVGAEGQELEFGPEEIKDLKAKMDGEFGAA